MKRVWIFFVFVFCIVCLPVKACIAFADDKSQETNFPQFFEALFGENVSKKSKRIDNVFVCGCPVGFVLSCDGVVVISVGEVEGFDGMEKPCDGCDIKQGDILLTIDGKKIESSQTIEKTLEENSDKDIFDFVVLRDRKRFVEHISPSFDVRSGKRRLGLWIRDNTAGVGTLTYVTKDGRFGALGHPVCDTDTGAFLPISQGSLFSCNIIGYSKSTKGKTGELKGVFVKSNRQIGTITKNCEFGVFGDIENQNSIFGKEMPVAKKNEVFPGRATILATINGMQPKEYEIEIVKTTNQTSQKSKSMVIRVVDSELLAKTGGIVQGMSGSPILQNGKFVGAVTHVFVSDPTKGFGIYAEWMLEE